MARFRKFRSSARRSFGAARKGFRRVRMGAAKHGIFGGKGGNDLVQIDAMAYGAVRPWASAQLDKLIPFDLPGNVDSEVKMAVAAWAVGKYVGKGMVRDVAHKALTVENYRVGEKLAGTMLGGTSSSSSSYLFG